MREESKNYENRQYGAFVAKKPKLLHEFLQNENKKVDLEPPSKIDPINILRGIPGRKSSSQRSNSVWTPSTYTNNDNAYLNPPSRLSIKNENSVLMWSND